MKKIRLLDAASQDLMDGFHFYEKQERGLGGYFLDSLFSDIDSLLIYAGIHKKYFHEYYRMLSKRFPFAVYYRIRGKFDLVFEGHEVLRDEIRETRTELKKDIEPCNFKIDTLNKKIDAVAADLKAHRADTEAHHGGVYLVKEISD